MVQKQGLSKTNRLHYHTRLPWQGMNFNSLKTYFYADGGQIVAKQTLSVFTGAVLHCAANQMFCAGMLPWPFLV